MSQPGRDYVKANILWGEAQLLCKRGYDPPDTYQSIAKRHGITPEEVEDSIQAIALAKMKERRLEKLSYQELLDLDPREYGWNTVTELILHVSDIQNTTYEIPGETEEERDEFELHHPEFSYPVGLANLADHWRQRGVL